MMHQKPSESPKRYYIKYTQKGKTYYKDQNGKRASKLKVLKSKKKVYEFIGSGQLQGQLIDRKLKVKTQKKKQPEKGRFITFGLLNINVVSEFTLSQEKGYRQYTKNTSTSEVFYLASKTSQANFLLFFTKVNKKFFELLKPLTDYPFFQIDLIENKGQKLSIFDFSVVSLKLKSRVKTPNKKVNEAFNKWVDYLNKEFNQTFQ